MEQLRFTAVHEDGQHLVLSTADGTELLLPVDARLRSALRSRSAPADAPATPLSPRNVQAMIRAGQSPEEVAEITGWPTERVARFEGPILAEREHVSGMAQAAHVRGRSPEGGVPTLGSRVLERLAERGVDTDNVGWDATRPEGGTWTVVVSFVAGQRQRAAAWQFDPVDRTVEALDDEARWLSEDEQALPGSAARGARSTSRGSGGRAADTPLLSGRSSAGDVDLVMSMRERSRSRGRRKKASTSSTDPAGLPQLEHAPEDVLPLEDLAYDPDTMGLPPAAHGESPAPGTATELEAAVDPEADGTDEPAAQRTTEQQQTGYDVPLQFDNDEVDPGESDEDLSPQESTLDDLFGPDEADEASELDDQPSGADDETSGHDDHLSEGTGTSGPDQRSGGDAVGTKNEDVEVELGEQVVEEDALELGGDLDEAETTQPDRSSDTASDAEPAPDSSDGDSSAEESNEDPAEAGDEPVKPTPKPKRRKDGRPGVPSWDDIMFGAKDRRG